MPPIDLAGDNTVGTMGSVQLYAGESSINTNWKKAATGLTFAKYEVYAVSAADEMIKFNPGGTAPATIARGFTAQPITVAGTTGPVFEAGTFNHEALVWPASGAGTYALRKGFFAVGNPDIHLNVLK